MALQELFSFQQWQLPPERIVKQKKLGEGMFGEVWRGTLDYNAKKVDVAIKIVSFPAKYLKR